MVPPLRQRKDDIPLLIDHFLTRFTRGSESPVQRFSPCALQALVDHSWPGNVRELENVIERLVVVGRTEVIEEEDLPADIRGPNRLRPAAASAAAPVPDVADDLYHRLVIQRESFWNSVYPMYMKRETREDLRHIISKGLQMTHGSYKHLATLFNMPLADYKRFLNFLRKHECQLPFQRFRGVLVEANDTSRGDHRSIDRAGRLTVPAGT